MLDPGLSTPSVAARGRVRALPAGVLRGACSTRGFGAGSLAVRKHLVGSAKATGTSVGRMLLTKALSGSAAGVAAGTGQLAAVGAVAGDITAARIVGGTQPRGMAAMDGAVLELDIRGFKPGGNVGRGVQPNGTMGGAATVQWSCDPLGSPKVVLTADMPGYDASGNPITVTEAVHGTVSLRNPYGAGGMEQTNDETAASDGSSVTIRVALTRQIPAGSTVTLVSAAPDLYRDNGPGGSGAASNGKEGLVVANNSTATLPKPIALPPTVPNQRLFQATDFEIGVAHQEGRAGRMAAAVRMTWTGRTSGASVTKVASTMVQASTVNRPGQPACPVFRCTFGSPADLAPFTQGEVIEWSFEVLPFVGPKLASLVDGSAYPTVNLPQSLPFLCDKANTLVAYATVDVAGTLANTNTSGCNATGAETTDAALCYATVADAAQALHTYMGRGEVAGGVIYLRAGTHANFGPNKSTLASRNHWLTITRAPSATRGQAVLSTVAGQSITATTGTNVRRNQPGMFRFHDLTIATATSATNDNVLLHLQDTTAAPTRFAWIDNCEVTGHAGASSPMLSQVGMQYWTNSLVGSNGAGLTTASGRHIALLSGCDLNGTTFVGTIANACVFRGFAASTGVKDPNGNVANVMALAKAWFAFNKVIGAKGVVTFATTSRAYPEGIARVQNVIESTQASIAGPASQLAADRDRNPVESAVDAYNTTMGERSNVCYDSEGTTAVFKRAARRFNVVQELYIKRDTFLDPVSGGGGTGKQAGRVGNWLSSHGVGSRGNVTKLGSFGKTYTSPDSDAGDFWPGGVIGAGSALTFTNDQSGVGVAGGGTYTLTGATNAAYGQVPPGLAMLPFDIAGTARRNDGAGAAGAYEAS